jgi:hypothetical protein
MESRTFPSFLSPPPWKGNRFWKKHRSYFAGLRAKLARISKILPEVKNRMLDHVISGRFSFLIGLNALEIQKKIGMEFEYIKRRPITKIFLKTKESRDSADGIVTGYGLDDRGIGVRVPVRSRIFTFRSRPDRLWGSPNFLFNG